MSDELQGLIKMMSFINKFKNIIRTVYVAGSSPRRFENDAEHSFELALCAWYLNQKMQLKLDTSKLIKYSIVHDLVEVYAGDIDPFLFPGQDIARIKADNESKAQEIILRDFSDFPELSESIHEYETKADEESKFVYALDKLICDIGITEIDGKTEKFCGISKESLEAIYTNKVSVSKPVDKLGQELMRTYNKRQSETGKFFADQDFIPNYKLELFTKQQKLIK